MICVKLRLSIGSCMLRLRLSIGSCMLWLRLSFRGSGEAPSSEAAPVSLSRHETMLGLSLSMHEHMLNLSLSMH